jgi:hypothetical protein
MESFAAAASHDAATIAAADPNCEFQNRRKYDHAFRLIEHALRDAIGCGQNFLHHRSGVLDTISLFVLRVGVPDQYGQH